MSQILSELEPSGVWFWFEKISAIPRESGNEEEISHFIVDFAKKRKLEYKRDKEGNVLIRKDSTGSAQSGVSLALQAHVDMVAEKTPESSHNFNKDPISLVVEGDWVKTVDTTLGADNGIGVAVMLAVLDSTDLPHPPLECIFTVDEERGLMGAAALDPSWIGSGQLINLDSENKDTFTVGCAGGQDVFISLNVSRQKPREPVVVYKLSVKGLKGGHSGMEIDRYRANALILLGHILKKFVSDNGALLVEINGGGKHNAIPSSAESIFTLPGSSNLDPESVVSDFSGEFEQEYKSIEDSIVIECERIGNSISMDPVSGNDSEKFCNLLLALPHGVEKMSGVVDDLVESSSNLAIVRTYHDKISIEMSLRSSIESARSSLARKIEAISKLAGTSYHSSGGYPGWIPDPDSELLQLATDVFREQKGYDPVISAIHAGLECGLIGEKVPGIQMMSVGPDIKDVHSPREKIGISSTVEFWEFLVNLLKRLSQV